MYNGIFKSKQSFLIAIFSILIIFEIILMFHYSRYEKIITTTNIKNIIYSDSNHPKQVNILTNNLHVIKPRYICNNNNIKIQPPNCQKLITGDEKEQGLANQFTSSCRRLDITDEEYISMTEDCVSFRRNQNYFTKVSKEEKDFPLAFSIMMYKDVHQVERLLKTIYRPHNHYCVHIDGKATSSVRKAMMNIVQCLPNVNLSSQFINVTWGRYSVLQPELVCMQDLLKYTTWKYFINLTGQELPLKTNLQIVRILSILQGANSVDADESRKWKYRWRRSGRPPHGINPIKGNLHVVLNRHFVDYVIHDKVSIDFLEWLKKTSIPDETFFPSLNHNPQLGIPGSYKGKNLTTNWTTKPYIARFKIWQKKHCQNPYYHLPCFGKWVRGICIFGIRDLPRLTSRIELFANKFHSNFMPITLDCMIEWYNDMVDVEYKSNDISNINVTYYRNIPYLQHIVKPYKTEDEPSTTPAYFN